MVARHRGAFNFPRPTTTTHPHVILLIDNYDSFVFNLARYFELLGHATQVVRNDAIDVDGVVAQRPDAIVISPGPCDPDQAGCSLAVVRQLAHRLPILGICLGHQAIGAALGASVVRAREPVHGRTSLIQHRGTSLFAGLPNPLAACRYHSLVVDSNTLPDCLEILAWTEDGVVMGIAHREWPLIGLQFHPESILTECGPALLAGFLRVAGLRAASISPGTWVELREPHATLAPLPQWPVTF